MTALTAAAETAIEQCLALQPDETFVVVTDEKRRPIGEVLYEAGRAVTDDASLLVYPPGDEHGEEPPAPVAAALEASEVFLAPTSKSLSHTRARSTASEAGARGATLPGITEDVFTTGLAADYEAIADACAAVYEQVVDASELRVTTPQGTDITFEVGDRAWGQDTGIIHEPGAFGNLPAGETFVGPVNANGVYVVDGTISPHGLLADDHSVTIEVEDGYVTSVDDEAVRRAIEQAEAKTGDDSPRNLAELGIGTNTGVTELVGSVLLDEKAAGTVHIAFGDNVGLGGDTEAPIHSDGILREPTVYADGERVTLPQPGD